MSDNQDTKEQDIVDDTPQFNVSELDLLKQRARLMGIQFSNNIGVDALKKKIEEATSEPKDQVNPLGPDIPEEETPMQLRRRIRDENMRLVRIRITCLDPKKKDLQGEILTVANEYIGTVRKFVPFGEVTEEGYHVPFILFKMLKRRKFLNIKTIKDKRTGTTRVESSYVPEFAIEVLDQLTESELKQLAAAQSAAGSVS